MLCRVEVAVANGGHRCRHEVTLAHIDVRWGFYGNSLVILLNPASHALVDVKAGCEMQGEKQEKNKRQNLLRVVNHLSQAWKPFHQDSSVSVCRRQNFRQLCYSQQTKVRKNLHVGRLECNSVI